MRELCRPLSWSFVDVATLINVDQNHGLATRNEKVESSILSLGSNNLPPKHGGPRPVPVVSTPGDDL